MSLSFLKNRILDRIIFFESVVIPSLKRGGKVKFTQLLVRQIISTAVIPSEHVKKFRGTEDSFKGERSEIAG
jgi:hypothetical protein